MGLAAAVSVIPDDLARVVDVADLGTEGAQRIVEGGVDAAAVEEAVLLEAGVEVIPDDLARVVDA
jgi:hypothetical protein